MMRLRRAPGLRRGSLLGFVLTGMLGLALVFFTMSSGGSQFHKGSEGHHPATLHTSGTHHASIDAEPESHEANAWCETACAVTASSLLERGPEVARSRGVPPAIVARIDEHFPDDPLPPPRLDVES